MKTIKSLTEAELSKLPEGWCWTKLGNIANFKNGVNFTKSQKGDIGILTLDVFNMYSKNIFPKLDNLYRVNITPKEEYILKNGDILFVRSSVKREGVGWTTVFKEISEQATYCGFIIRGRLLTNDIFPEYMVYYLRTASARNNIIDSSSQVTITNINQNSLGAIPVPLSSFPEQRAIVSKIEMLFSELDNGIVNLKLAQEQLKVYRQAVLKKAFEGELTKKWREQQTNLPDALDLLEQIRVEREEEARVSGRKQKLIKPLTEAELAGLPKMPEGWICVRLDAIGELFCGQSPSIIEVNIERRGILYVTGPEQWDGSKIKETKWTEFPKRLVPEGCIFITVKGAGVGKTFPGISCAIGRDIYAFLPSSKVDFKYTIHALIHQIDVVIMKAQGDIPGLSKDHILDHYIGLCSIEEQHAIVQEIEKRLSVCDKISQDIEENLEKAEALRQSILKKAFEGKLLNEKELAEVRKAEDWEPAEVLLERIKVEREGNGKSKKQIPEQSKKIIRDEKGLTQQATLQVFEQVDN